MYEKCLFDVISAFFCSNKSYNKRVQMEDSNGRALAPAAFISLMLHPSTYACYSFYPFLCQHYTLFIFLFSLTDLSFALPFSISLFFNPSLLLSLFFSLYLSSISPSIYPSNWIFLFMSISIRLSIYLSFYLYISLFIYLSQYES